MLKIYQINHTRQVVKATHKSDSNMYTWDWRKLLPFCSYWGILLVFKTNHECQIFLTTSSIEFFSLMFTLFKHFWRAGVLYVGLPVPLFYPCTCCLKGRRNPSLPCFTACVRWILQVHLWCDTYWPLGGQHGTSATLAPVHMSRKSRIPAIVWPFCFEIHETDMSIMHLSQKYQISRNRKKERNYIMK